MSQSVSSRYTISSTSVLITFVVITVFLVSLTAYAKFIFAKDFTFYIEAPCDETEGTCFLRDCENDGCPPNNLSSYKAYYINASDYTSCNDNSCANICQSTPTKSKCSEIVCDPTVGDSCNSPVK